MSLEERSKKRRMRAISRRSWSLEEAEQWNLSYWQSMTQAERLEAYLAIREDIEKVQASRIRDDHLKKAY